MTFKNSWYVNQRILHLKFAGAITVEELVEAIKISNGLVKTGTPPVHELIDMRDITQFPYTLSKLSQLVPYLGEPNLGWMLVMTNDMMITFISNTMAQIGHARLRTFETLEEALNFIADMDRTLPPLPSYETAETVEPA